MDRLPYFVSGVLALLAVGFVAGAIVAGWYQEPRFIAIAAALAALSAAGSVAAWTTPQ